MHINSANSSKTFNAPIRFNKNRLKTTPKRLDIQKTSYFRRRKRLLPHATKGLQQGGDTLNALGNKNHDLRNVNTPAFSDRKRFWVSHRSASGKEHKECVCQKMLRRIFLQSAEADHSPYCVKHSTVFSLPSLPFGCSIGLRRVIFK